MPKKQSETYHQELQAKLAETTNEVHNVKMLTYINTAILVILLAFVVGVVLKQLNF